MVSASLDGLHKNLAHAGETMMVALSGNSSRFHLCHKNSLPYLPVHLATGRLLRLNNNENAVIPIVCGTLSSMSLKTKMGCYNLATGRQVITSKTIYREDAASVAIGNGTKLWIAGGATWNNPNPDHKSSVIVSIQENCGDIMAHPFLEMPAFLWGHCMEVLTIFGGGGVEKVILYGSNLRQPFVRFDDTWIVELYGLDPTYSSSWQNLTIMNMKRTHHACGVLKTTTANDLEDIEIVVAAGGHGKIMEDGGWNALDTVLDSVEIMVVGKGSDLRDLKWEPGPQLPVPLMSSASTVVKDEGGQQLFVIGGWTDYETRAESHYVFSLACSASGSDSSMHLSCSWTKHDFELPYRGASKSVAIAVSSQQWLESSHDAQIDVPCIDELTANNECDGVNNNMICGYDGGDCCLLPSSRVDDEDLASCANCQGTSCVCHETGSHHCIGEYYSWITFLQAQKPICFLKGTCPSGLDGHCNGQNNNPECNYDDGDCCLEFSDCRSCLGDQCICHSTGMDHCHGKNLLK